MIRYFFGHVRASLGDQKTLIFLSVCGVALGVASVASIQLINANAIAAFRAGVDVVSGPADVSVVGKEADFDETLFPKIRQQPGVINAWPSVSFHVALVERPNLYLRVLGVDVFNASRRSMSGSSGDLTTFLRTPGACAITPALGRELDRNVGNQIPVSLGSRSYALVVASHIDLEHWSPMASRKTVVMDIANAQSLFGRRGRINEVSIELAPGVDREMFIAALQRELGPEVDVMTTAGREQKASALLSAFQLNLSALSLISLFVGMFLVYSCTQAAMVRRRAEFGLLRTLGATRPQLARLIFGEAVGLGVVGAAIGLPFGIWAASKNLQSVSDTISNLYILSEIDHLALPLGVVVKATFIGVGAAMLGAVLPVIDVCRRDTKALLSSQGWHEKTTNMAPRLFSIALLSLVAVSTWMALGGWRYRPSGFVFALVILLAIPLMTPALMRAVLGRVRVTNLGWRFGLKGLVVRLGSSAFAVAGVAIAVTMLVGVTFMISSFRKTLDVWIGQTLEADIYITSASWRRAREAATLDSDLVRALSEDQAVLKADRLRQIFVDIDGQRVPLSGVDMPAPLSATRIPLVQGDSRTLLTDLNAGRVLIGEPLLRLRDHKIGDRLTVSRGGRTVALPVAAVYFDYGNQAGSVMMSLARMNEIFGEGPLTNVALTLKHGEDVEATVDRLRAQFAPVPIEIRSNRHLRTEVMSIFDQTFAVTRLLQLMSLAIAGCGIALTLFLSARERLSEWALLRALGAQPAQLRRLFLGQGVGIAALGTALGLVGGVALMAILVFLINRAYFGWTIQLYWPGGILFQQIAAIFAVALVASVIPANHAGKISAKELSRDNG